MLSVYTPVTHNYSVSCYVLICQPLSHISDLQYGLLNSYYLSLIFLLLLALIILLTFIFAVYRPLQVIIRAARNYADGNFDTALEMERQDEIGTLADTLHFMALELNALENDQHKFVSNVSHDFRSPLTSIKGYAQAMADGTIPSELQGKYLDVIIFESERLEKLTQSLLELNKYGTKGTYLDLSVFDLNALIKRTLLMFEGRCKEKMVSFHLILTGEELYVKADSAKIDQVMHNLVDNAFKFSHSNSEITIETTLRNGKVFVSVKDQGIGIPKESIGRIWERFYKTDASRGKDKREPVVGWPSLRKSYMPIMKISMSSDRRCWYRIYLYAALYQRGYGFCQRRQLMNAVALRPAVKRTFAIRFRYLLMNAVALRPAFQKRCALCVIRTHIFLYFLYLMNYLSIVTIAFSRMVRFFFFSGFTAAL